MISKTDFIFRLQLTEIIFNEVFLSISSSKRMMQQWISGTLLTQRWIV